MATVNDKDGFTQLTKLNVTDELLLKGMAISEALSTEDINFLSKWTVDEEEKVVSTEYTIKSGLNSFRLGDIHSDHSASQNKFTENRVSHINWFPTWQGISPFVALDTAMTVNPTARQYTKPFELLTNGASSTASNVVYTAQVTLVNNESILRLEIEAGEAYEGELNYTIKNNDVNGLVMYTQLRNIDVAEGELIVFEFTYQGDDSPFTYGHPSENHAGAVIFVEMSKEDGTEFLVKAGTNNATPWLRLTLMNFLDQEISAGVVLVDASQDVLYNSQYAVDTNNGVVTLTVDTTTGLQSFTVFDADQNFNQNSCIVDFGGGNTATLQTKNDGYLFYLDGATWHFLDLNTKNGGIV